MNCMTGLLKFSEGSIQLLGHEIAHHKKSINKLFGFVPQDFSFYQELSPAENLAFFGAWSGLQKSEIKYKTTELLEVMGLTEVRNKKVEQFSGGMKRRVNLAIGVIHNPRILFLDEPTVGVDVQSRNVIIEHLKEVNATGTTIIYTSHHMEEAENFCTRVAIIDHGKILTEGTPAELISRNAGSTNLENVFLNLTNRKLRD